MHFFGGLAMTLRLSFQHPVINIACILALVEGYARNV
jgi:hypothetical protein